MAGPPLFLQRAVAALLTPIGRLLGYRGRYDEYLTRGPSMIVEPEPLPLNHSMPLITARRSGE
jgi:hypothetical protein